MREYTATYREAFVKGISQVADVAKGADRLAFATNFRPYEGGARLQQLPVPIVNGVYKTQWPYPQLYFTDIGFWLCSKDAISLFSPELRLARYIEGLADPDPDIRSWSVATFGRFALATNGGQWVYRDHQDGDKLKTYSNAEVPLGRCCCDFNRGRLIIGGPPTSWYDCHQHFIAWSKIGDVDCTPDGNNEAGYMPMDWDGPVLAVRQLGQGVMVYGRYGISYVQPVAEPAPTFAHKLIASYGIPDSTCMDGNRAEHVFLDTAGDLWRINSSLQLENLGGKRVLTNLVKSSTLAVSYHPRRREAYVSTYEFHYVRTRTGWGGPNRVPLSGVAYYKPPNLVGGLAVVPCRSNEPALDSALFSTEIQDFDHAGQETLQWIEVNCSALCDRLWVKARYRYGPTDAWRDTDKVLVNREGFAYLSVAGTEFFIIVELEYPSAAEVDALKVRWKPTDKRYMRGPDPSTQRRQ